jgi:acetoin:2,6-dichlorophenolindophenol oxidoreductase subunit beta
MMAVYNTNYVRAVRDGIAEEMRKNPNIIMIGEGVAERGGAFGQAKGLWAEFGKDRVFDTPISENGFTAMAIGAAITGLRPIVDLIFADILYELMSPLCQQAAKLSYISNGSIHVPVVIRAQMAGRGFGPHHEGCLYPLFMHIPGIKVVIPCNPYKGKGLIKTALNDPNPVIFFENKGAMQEKGDVPENEYYIPFGKADVIREGKDVTIVALGITVKKVLSVVADNELGLDIEVIDPMTLVPLDMDTILKSVKKTGRLIIVEEAHLTCNAGAEIAAQVCSSGFAYLRAPVMRLSNMNVPTPFSPVLETAVTPGEQEIRNAIRTITGM